MAAAEVPVVAVKASAPPDGAEQDVKVVSESEVPVMERRSFAPMVADTAAPMPEERERYENVQLVIVRFPPVTVTADVVSARVD